MLIRSQDKRAIINIENLAYISISECKIETEKYIYEIYTTCPGRTGGTIACYSTEEKAIKILDMIENAYQKSFEEKQNNYVGHRYELIFHMPQDNEV